MTETGTARPLAGLRAGDAVLYGGKSAALGELLSAGIEVPPGFGLAAGAFRAFLAEAGLERTVADAVARVTAGDVDSLGAASHAIGEAMRFAPMPEAVRDEIASHYARLGDDAPVAVRSSAIGEDSEEATFAGQQDTYLWVRGVEHVCDAVRDCWVSLYSAPALSYRARLADAPDAAMGVTVQLMVDAVVSGVLFTCNPVSGDPSMVAVNASWGLGLAVVGGEVTPDDFLVSKVTREVVRQHIHAKDVQYVPDPRGRGAVRVDVPPGLRETACLDAGALVSLVDLGRLIERHFGSHQDVEWAIDREGSLYVLQSRPVTAMTRLHTPPPADAMSLVMQTFGARGR